MVRTLSVLSVAVALASCARDRIPRGGETITYRADHAICFDCANISLVLGPDGQGIITVRRGGTDQPDRLFQASPAEVAAFTERLRPYRPKGERLIGWAADPKARCRNFGTDGYRFDIQWQMALGSRDHLAFDSGCDLRHTAGMATALDAAPRALPIAGLLDGH